MTQKRFAASHYMRLNSALLDKVFQWRVILQGVLASALFWLILRLGTYALRKLSRTFRGISKRHQLELLKARLILHTGWAINDQPAVTLALIHSLYSVANYLCKALAMVCLGLIFGSIVPVFGVVGFVMSLYYLLMAVNMVPLTGPADSKKEIERLEKRIAELEAME